MKLTFHLTGFLLLGSVLVTGDARADEVANRRGDADLLPLGLMEEVFTQARQTVEDYTGSRTKVALEVITGDAAAWTKSSSPLPLAFYSQSAKQITVHRAPVERCLRGRKWGRGETIKDYLFCLFLHEVVHSYQDTVLRQAKGPGPSAKWRRFVLEGHSVAMTERLARQAKVPDPLIRSFIPEPPAAGQGDLDQNRSAALDYFSYALGRAYFGEHGVSAAALVKAWEVPPSYSSLIGCGSKHDRVRSVAAGALRGCFPKERVPWTCGKPVSLDFLDCALALCPSIAFDRGLCETYMDGAIAEVGLAEELSAEVMLLLFQDDRSQRFVDKLVRYARTRTRLDDRPSNRGRDHILFLADYPEPGQAVCSQGAGNWLILIIVDQSSCGREAAQKLLDQIKGALR
ncbi:MAG TPA: hypothetical protein VH682_09405 [Gemmataceae bacterium]